MGRSGQWNIAWRLLWHIGVMEGHSSRRGFLRSLVRESARTAQEAGKLLGPPRSGPGRPEPAPPRPKPEVVLERARAATRTVTVEELLELGTELGLGDRLDDLRELARSSVRMTSPTLDDHPAGDWLFEPSAGLLEEDDRPLWGGERLTLVAQLDLGDPALRDVDLPLPRDGRLVFLYAALQAPSGELASHAGAGRVLNLPAPSGVAPTARLSVELTLPRVWSAPVQRLKLDPIEHDGYLKLRRRLAMLQDVELDDGFGEPIAYHRVLGYPNETSGLMPTTCELASGGMDATFIDLAEEELGSRAARWRLLLQLSADASSPWTLGGSGGRLYFWIDEDDLRAADFSRVWTVAQPQGA
jgi:hypothetical protein